MCHLQKIYMITGACSSSLSTCTATYFAPWREDEKGCVQQLQSYCLMEYWRTLRCYFGTVKPTKTKITLLIAPWSQVLHPHVELYAASASWEAYHHSSAHYQCLHSIAQPFPSSNSDPIDTAPQTHPMTLPGWTVAPCPLLHGWDATHPSSIPRAPRHGPVSTESWGSAPLAQEKYSRRNTQSTESSLHLPLSFGAGRSSMRGSCGQRGQLHLVGPFGLCQALKDGFALTDFQPSEIYASQET